MQPRLLDIPRRFPSEAPVVYRRASPLVIAIQTAEARHALSVLRDAQALLQRSLTSSFAIKFLVGALIRCLEHGASTKSARRLRAGG